MTIRGQGKAFATQSIANVDISIESLQKSAKAAQSKVSSIASDVVKHLKGLSFVKEIQTVSVTLTPNYPKRPNKYYQQNEEEVGSEVVSYTASTSLAFKIVTISKAGQLIDELVQMGVTKINDVMLTASEEEIERATDLAIKNGMNDALRKAQTALSSIDSEITLNKKHHIVDISFSPYYSPPSSYRSSRRYSGASYVVSGQSTVSATVTLKLKV
ncbi:hypothetical protein ABK040_000102 [Willaertia magna]